MRVFITGATGVVGGAALRALVAGGHEVVGLTSRAKNAAAIEKLGARAIVGDMRDAASYGAEVRAADAVIHAAAAMPDKTRYTKADVDTLMSADEDALNALMTVLSPACRILLITSGAWVYGDTGTTPVAESHSTDKPYAASLQRAQLERKLLALAKEGKVPTVFARPGLIYGQGSLWGKLYVDAMKRGQRAMMPGNGANMLSFIHEDDVGAAYRVLIEKASPGEAYNLADDEPGPVRAVVEAQARAMGAPAPRSVPGFLIRLVAGSYSAPPLLGHSVLSNQKLKALGFACRYPTYREGVIAVAARAKESGAS